MSDKRINWQKIVDAVLDNLGVNDLSLEEKEIYNQLIASKNDGDILHVLKNIDNRQAWQKVSETLNLPADKTVAPIRKLYRVVRVAAIFLIVFGIGYLLVSNFRSNDNPKEKIDTVAVNKDVKPGSNRAVLIVDGNHFFSLDSIKNGAINLAGNANCRIENGELVYVNVNSTSTAAKYNEVQTPRGGQYKIRLADGTNVWLNAASSIRYPVPFAMNERSVEVSGEAYFEVAKNKEKPFVVLAPGHSKVTVLGTHFNVTAYADDQKMKTTLLEGKIRMDAEKQSQIVKPGDQIVLSRDGTMKVNHDVDTSGVVAWKNGYFNFNNEELEAVLKQISRWYNVQVIYEGKIPEKRFMGEIQRDLNLAELLQVLEKSNIHFKIKNQTISVMP